MLKSGKTCRCCRRYRALYRRRGGVSFRPDHDLCQSCYRAAVNRLRQSLLQAPSV